MAEQSFRNCRYSSAHPSYKKSQSLIEKEPRYELLLTCESEECANYYMEDVEGSDSLAVIAIPDSRVCEICSFWSLDSYK